MNYTEIKTLAYAYADRQDTDSLDRYDDFLRITESKLNRKLKTLDNGTAQVTAPAVPTSSVPLPDAFGGIRRIVYTDANGKDHNFKQAPEHMVDEEFRIKEYRDLPTDLFYAVTPSTIEFSHEFSDGSIAVYYYRRVVPLTSLAPNNWVSDDFPDAYAFSVRAEIGAFVKNMQSAADWEARFEKIVEEMVADDKDRRWSGEPLQMRTQ